MKEIINYYYNFDCLEIIENKNYTTFTHLGDKYYFVFFNRENDELKDIIDIIEELKLKGIKVHNIILNRFNSYVTKVRPPPYV